MRKRLLAIILGIAVFNGRGNSIPVRKARGSDKFSHHNAKSIEL